MNLSIPAKTSKYEQQMEEEERDMYFARLGHNFTYDRQQFWAQASNIHANLRWELVTFGMDHPLNTEVVPMADK